MPHDCRLYLLTPPVLPHDFAKTLAADVAAEQLRLTEADDDAIHRAADVVRPVAHARGVALILNNRPDLAVQTGCDGAHVGAADMAPAEARRVLGPKLQLGVSCYDSRDMALRAGEANADYVSFGAFFPSTTKTAESEPELELVSWWAELMELPVVAVGGITPENCTTLVRAGADFVAACGAVWRADSPDAVVRAFNAAIAEA